MTLQFNFKCTILLVIVWGFAANSWGKDYLSCQEAGSPRFLLPFAAGTEASLLSASNVNTSSQDRFPKNGLGKNDPGRIDLEQGDPIEDENPFQTLVRETHPVFQQYNHPDKDLAGKHFSKVYGIAKKYHRRPSLCRQKLKEFYRNDSMWAGLSEAERLARINRISLQVFSDLVEDSFEETCALLAFGNEQKAFFPKVLSFLQEKMLQRLKQEYGTDKNIYNHQLRQVLTLLLQEVSAAHLQDFFAQDSQYERLNADIIQKTFLHKMRSAKLLSWELDARSRINYYTHADLIAFLISKLNATLLPIIREQFLVQVKKDLRGAYQFNWSEWSHPAKIASACSQAWKNVKLKQSLLFYSFSPNFKVDDVNRIMTIVDPRILHVETSPDAIRCLIAQETKPVFDPHILNYTYCFKSSRNWMRSSAHGLGQTTFTSFHYLRRIGMMPLLDPDYAQYNPKSKRDNRIIFESLSSNIPAQIEVIYRHLNYYMKKRGDLIKGIISYDRDSRSTYIKNVKKCFKCMGHHEWGAWDDNQGCFR